jgi:hypothetical protein
MAFDDGIGVGIGEGFLVGSTIGAADGWERQMAFLKVVKLARL